ncbi:hypothetical protein QAD02_000819 [Eretmocerus hayati]|uniref:Uncharacterized protein n=1 Tax=Eretmocerus hayati TaxID=131215 RepID=A0ACC2NEG7_9HYME|nr:hypothetical protein QAD02_000819 [Eretmocerus hayati]
MSRLGLHLLVPFSDMDHHLELEPYHDFISPHMVVEKRAIDGDPYDSMYDGDIEFKSPDIELCHYRGTIRGHKNSRAALSLCDGVVGYIKTNHGKYLIEPLEEDKPKFDGQRVHVVYSSDQKTKARQLETGQKSCATSDDWENVWTRRLAQLETSEKEKNSAPPGENSQNEKPSSSSHSIHRYIEIAMVADRSFLDHHKNTNHEQYLLTVANIASDLFHDASVGNQIDLVVVRMIYLERQEKEVDLHINTDAEDTLKSFAGWVAKLSPSDPQHPNHFDIGVLVTRYDICSKAGDCNVVGLAYVAGACERKDAGCITEDNGIGLGDTIAHEIGHMLGCAHDSEDISGCSPTAKDGSTYVMAAVSTGAGTYSWSECSRKFITKFFESGLGECFLNNPKNPPDKYKFPNMLPGAVYATDFQCNLAFPGSEVCSMNQDVCEQLWCKVGDTCKSRSGAAEGTKCAEGKWCIHHKCVKIGTRGSAINGGWSDWGPMNKCSRTCGGGVQVSERECNNPTPENGGRYCIGERKKFSICNTNPCDKAKPSFRAIQCAKYDGDLSVNGVAHKWKPFTRHDLDTCALYCLNEKDTFYKLSPAAEDGTPCQAGTNNICIGGVCRKVGCDWIIDSDAVEDVCGVCKGGGTDCTQVQGTFEEQGKRGYTKVVIIPKGSRNIVIQELQESTNILAVKLPRSSKYCLNDKNTENLDGDYQCAGVNMIYKHVKTKMERIEIKNAIEEDMEIQYVFFEPNNPGVEYTYYVDQPNKSRTPTYFWDNVEWNECDVKCGGGTQPHVRPHVEAGRVAGMAVALRRGDDHGG